MHLPVQEFRLSPIRISKKAVTVHFITGEQQQKVFSSKPLVLILTSLSQPVNLCGKLLLYFFTVLLPSAKADLSCNLQSHGKQKQYSISPIEHCRKRCDTVHDDLRIIYDLCLIQQYPTGYHSQAEKDHHNETPVPVVKSVNGKSSSAFQRISAAFHGNAAVHKIFQSPGDHNGDQADPV